MEGIHLVRAGWNARPGLMQRPREAGGSQGVEACASGGRSPDNVTAGRHCQTPACVLARPKGEAKANWWRKPLYLDHGPKPGGHGSDTATVPPYEMAAPLHARLCILGAGGRWETASARRKRCRGTASRRPGQTDHGERRKRPRPRRLLVAAGKARCLLMGRGRGGGAVVLRGRESRPHREGRQQDRSFRCRSGGRA
jgi:hypothetical protein